MEYFKFIYSYVFSLMNIPINIFGYSISLFSVTYFSLMASLFIYFLKKLID